jgi:uncharacterized protein YbcI
MPAPNTPLTGDPLLLAVTDAMVAFHLHYYHREPVNARTMLIDDELLVCVLEGVYTEVEKTMIEIQRTPIVQDTRDAFQAAMQGKLVASVGRLSGRSVDALSSNHHIGPDLEVQVFILGPALSEARVSSRA